MESIYFPIATLTHLHIPLAKERQASSAALHHCHGNPFTPDKAFAEESNSVLRKTIKLASLLHVPVVRTFSGTSGDSD